MASLPESIGNLIKLKWLAVDGNLLTKITNSLSKLNKIEYINLSKNPIDLSNPTNKEVIKYFRDTGSWVFFD